MVINGYLEGIDFEFKPGLKDYTNKNQLTDKIRKTTCAFANTDGGFIIFDSEDDGNVFPVELLISDESGFVILSSPLRILLVCAFKS